MGIENKRIEKISKDLDKLRQEVLKVKRAKKFEKLSNWKQFRANVNKEDKNNDR